MRSHLLSVLAVLVLGGLAVAQDKPAVVVTPEAKAVEKPAMVVTPEAKAVEKPAVVVTPEAKAPEKTEKAAPPPPPKTVKIIINTTPRRRARVYHGRKKLGVTPLVLDLPYDSGPRDIVVRTPGFIAVNTRIYTFKDEKVIVALTREEEASALFGYREKIPSDGGASDSADAGLGVNPAATPPAAAPDPAATTPAAPDPAPPPPKVP